MQIAQNSEIFASLYPSIVKAYLLNNYSPSNAQDYLLKGHKIKASLRFKGREMAHTELGREVLEKFAEELSECSIIETKPKLEGRTMTMILAPKK